MEEVSHRDLVLPESVIQQNQIKPKTLSGFFTLDSSIKKIEVW